MNRKELADAIGDLTGQTRAESDRFIAAFIEVVTRNMKKSDGVRLVGFGSFTVVKRKARAARNPQTGEKIRIPARKSPVFRAGSLLRKAVAGKSTSRR